MNKLVLILILAFGFTCFEVKAQTPSPTPETAPRDARAWEEYQQKVAEVEEKNRQIAENNRKIRQALADGAKAYEEKNYRLALEKFDEAYNLSPDFWGTAPVMLNNKAMSLIQLGVETYNNALKNKQNPRPESNRLFHDAVVFLKQSQKILENAPPPEDESAKAQIDSTRYVSIKELAEAYWLLVLTDETKVFEAVEALENYIKIEKDLLLKEKAQKNLQNLKSKLKIN